MQTEPVMRPAFISIRSAAAFVLMLVVLLALPAVVGQKGLPVREQAYSSIGWGSGPYPWIRNQIFEETNDIDIAFVGSSHIFNAIYTPYVQEKLSEKLGRPAVVRTIAWGGAGYDGLYLITQDLLAHRRVRFLVFYDESNTGSLRYSQSPMLFRFGENRGMLDGLSVRERALFYFASIIGMPRNLLCLLRPNLPAPFVTDKPNYWTVVANSPNPATQLGCLSVRKGFTPDLAIAAAPFEALMPKTSAQPADALVYSPDTKSDFEFSTKPIPDWQAHFAHLFARLLQKHGTQPVMLYLPVLADCPSHVIPERTFWPKIIDGITLLGIPPAKMFDGLTDAELHKIFGDPFHLNQNGQAYFTRLITPALFRLYEKPVNR